MFYPLPSHEQNNWHYYDKLTLINIYPAGTEERLMKLLCTQFLKTVRKRERMAIAQTTTKSAH